MVCAEDELLELESELDVLEVEALATASRDSGSVDMSANVARNVDGVECQVRREYETTMAVVRTKAVGDGDERWYVNRNNDGSVDGREYGMAMTTIATDEKERGSGFKVKTGTMRVDAENTKGGGCSEK